MIVDVDYDIIWRHSHQTCVSLYIKQAQVYVAYAKYFWYVLLERQSKRGSIKWICLYVWGITVTTCLLTYLLTNLLTNLPTYIATCFLTYLKLNLY